MKTRVAPRAGLIGFAFLCAFIFFLSEPAAFLESSFANILLRCMPNKERGTVRKVTLQLDVSAEKIADQIATLKLRGIRYILLAIPAQDARAQWLLADPAVSDGVVWMANPSALAPELRSRGVFRPLLVCNKNGSAVLAEKGAGKPRSATTLALTCCGDTKTFTRIGHNPFRILFSKSSYDLNPVDTNVVLACVTVPETKSTHTCSTPAGFRTSADYALDVCQALLDNRYLLEMPEIYRQAIILVAICIFSVLPGFRLRIGFVAAFSLFSLVVAVVTRTHVPIVPALFGCAFTIMIEQLTGVRLWIQIRSALARSPWQYHAAALLGFVSLGWAGVLEGIFKNRAEMIGLSAGAVALVVWTLVSLSIPEDTRPRIERLIFGMFVLLACIMCLAPHLLNPVPNFSPAYRSLVRWRAWTLDPNNSAIIVGIAAAVALRLARQSNGLLRILAGCASGLCILQLVRSFSRVGLLALLVSTLVWAWPEWRQWKGGWKALVSWTCLGVLCLIPVLAWIGRSSEILPLRRLASASNVLDLSWANRVYVMPGVIQAALDRPWSGHGWKEILDLHKAVYCPTFLEHNSALLLNDFAHTAASCGIPAALGLILFIAWCLVRGRNSYPKMLAAGLAVGMFFQGVLRNPITLLPFCMAGGMILGESRPWTLRNIKLGGSRISLVPAFCLAAFFLAWCGFPLLLSNTASFSEHVLAASPRHPANLSICFVTNDKLEIYGREVRALVSLGIRGLAIHPPELELMEQRYGTNIWFVDSSSGPRRIPPSIAAAPTPTDRALNAMHFVYDTGVPEARPSPDHPYDLRIVLITLYACALLIVVKECWLSSARRLMPTLISGSIALACVLVYAHAASWQNENRELADWARQMRKTPMPEDVYREYVLNPEIAPNFVLKNRRDVWLTFYQTTYDPNPKKLIAKLKRDIEIQFLLRPDSSPSVRPFEEMWETRTCNLAERWYVLAGALRALNIPARIHDGRAEMWIDGNWVSTDPKAVSH